MAKYKNVAYGYTLTRQLPKGSDPAFDQISDDQNMPSFKEALRVAKGVADVSGKDEAGRPLYSSICISRAHDVGDDFIMKYWEYEWRNKGDELYGTRFGGNVAPRTGWYDMNSDY